MMCAPRPHPPPPRRRRTTTTRQGTAKRKHRGERRGMGRDDARTHVLFRLCSLRRIGQVKSFSDGNWRNQLWVARRHFIQQASRRSQLLLELRHAIGQGHLLLRLVDVIAARGRLGGVHGRRRERASHAKEKAPSSRSPPETLARRDGPLSRDLSRRAASQSAQQQQPPPAIFSSQHGSAVETV